MPKFIIHETCSCRVTFVKTVEADDETDAMNMAHDGDGELIGVAIGDNVDGEETIGIRPDHPSSIPYGMWSQRV